MEIEETKDYSSYHLIPDEIKWAIIFLKKLGGSNKGIASAIFQHFNRSVCHKSVKRVWEKFQRTDSLENQWNQAGRPRLLTEDDLEALALHCVEDRIASVKERIEDLGIEASRETVNRRLLDMGYKAYRARKKPLLTEEHMFERL